LEAERHEEYRRAAGLLRQGFNTLAIEVIVVIVGNDDDIDVRQIAQRDPANRNGEARREKIGSVSTLSPLACTKAVA
jgi:hypothetical protein